MAAAPGAAADQAEAGAVTARAVTQRRRRRRTPSRRQQPDPRNRRAGAEGAGTSAGPDGRPRQQRQPVGTGGRRRWRPVPDSRGTLIDRRPRAARGHLGSWQASTPCVPKSSRSSSSSANIPPREIRASTSLHGRWSPTRWSTSPPSGPRISGMGRGQDEDGLMLTTDANIVDIELPGRLEHPGSREAAVQHPRSAADGAGRVRIRDARDHRGVEPRPDPQPRPGSDRGYRDAEHPGHAQ